MCGQLLRERAACSFVRGKEVAGAESEDKCCLCCLCAVDKVYVQCDDAFDIESMMLFYDNGLRFVGR